MSLKSEEEIIQKLHDDIAHWDNWESEDEYTGVLNGLARAIDIVKAAETIDAIPMADIKEAVRCKTCQRWENRSTGWSYCRQTGDYTGENGLCKYWTRREG